MAFTLNLSQDTRAERKLMLTYVDWGGTWTGKTSYDPSDGNLSLIGARVEDSSIELNPDTETTTDILGVTHTDFNKTEPQQDFDPFYVIGKGTDGSGGKLSEYLVRALLADRKTDYESKFTVFVVTMFLSETVTDSTAEPTTTTRYYTVAHRNCTIYPTSLGGDAYVSMPIEVHLSNDIVEGYVTKLTEANFDFAVSA